MKVVELLKPFKSWTDRVEADKEVTIDRVWPTLIQMEDYLKAATNNDPELENDEDFKMIEGMKALGREYISYIRSDINPTENQKMAVVLNPTMKKTSKLSAVVLDNIYDQIDQIVRRSTESNTSSNAVEKRVQKKNTNTNSLDEFMNTDSDDDSTESSVYSPELTAYLKDRISNRSTFDLRSWWFQNRERYPTLFKIFLRISAIPASSAPSDRTFSTSGSVITERRSSLLPKSVENIMLVRNLYRS